jgi:multiple sugar transport system substrate-binding protein
MAYSLKYKINITLLTLVSLFTLTGVGCRPQENTGRILDTDITLVVWGLWEESATLDPIITSFQEETGINIEYRKIASVAEYEKKLLEALAEGRGPDIFVIHHTWVETKRGIMSPAPSDVIDERALKEEFVDVVAGDVVRDGNIYALPVSVDTLGLYYNKDLLSTAGVARPPKTWDEFLQVVERMTKVNRLGVIEQSAAAIGTATNVSRAADILQLLFLQSGLTIVDDRNRVSLSGDEGVSALTFYTDFANKSKKAYTWDLQQDYSLDSFAEGETAMMLNYSYHIPTIKAKNPRLRFDVAPAPQIADSKVINFAAYWPYAVSNRSTAPSVAWQFLRHITNTESSMAIIRSQLIPPARRDGVASLSRDPALGVFSEQALTAVSWRRGDIVAIDAIVNTMIDNVVTGAATVSNSLGRGQEQINQVQPEPVSQEEGEGQSFQDSGIKPF